MNKVKKIVIFYFTGTGNAKKIAAWIKEFAINSNIDCQTTNITMANINTRSLSPDTLIIIISPTHGFNFPKITIDFIRHFPKGGNNTILMNTRGGMKLGRFVTPGLTGIAFLLASLILKRKGYKIVGQIPFDMPSNWISLHPGLRENTIKYIHKENYCRVEKHCNKIFAGKKDFLAYRDLIQDILISPVSLGYYIAGRFAFAKSFYASDSCNNCGICIKQCPVNAIITIKKHPYWTFKCESCMRCMNSCPKRAIETAHGLILVTSVFSSSIITIVLNNIKEINIPSGFLGLTVFTLVFLALLWILYKFQHLLLKIKFIRKLVALTSLTHYKFWGRYKSIPDKVWKL